MKFLFYTIFLSVISHAWEYSPEELEEKRLLLESWKALAAQPLPEENHDEYISKLGSALRATANSKDDRTDRREVYWSLSERLLSIPGHAEYYRDRINHCRAIVDDYKTAEAEGRGAYGDVGRSINHLETEQMFGFRTLENLPSVETVGVLGEFLADERGWEVPKAERYESGEVPNHRYAARTLSRLGIVNSPTEPMETSEDITNGLEAWRVWYQEVKGGRRTFRFKGDPVEYTLRGSSKHGAVEPYRTRDGKRAVDDGGSGNESALPEEEGISQQEIGVIIAGLFLVVGFFVYRRKQAKG